MYPLSTYIYFSSNNLSVCIVTFLFASSSLRFDTSFSLFRRPSCIEFSRSAYRSPIVRDRKIVLIQDADVCLFDPLLVHVFHLPNSFLPLCLTYICLPFSATAFCAALQYMSVNIRLSQPVALHYQRATVCCIPISI